MNYGYASGVLPLFANISAILTINFLILCNILLIIITNILSNIPLKAKNK